MTEATMSQAAPATTDVNVLSRILEEGYGAGAWHGPDLKTALSDVSPTTAFWRPGPGRHNIAEITMHHAWCVRSVANQVSGSEAKPFALAGEDWFLLSGEQKDLNWEKIVAVLDQEQARLSEIVGRIGAGGQSALDDAKTLSLVVGITCHAVYHAGQVQLVKVLNA
jgi:hypothetical protein